MTIVNYGDVQITIDATQVMDDINAGVPALTGIATDTFANAGANYTILWPLSYKVDSVAVQTNPPTITVNGVPAEVVIGAPTGGCGQFSIVALNQAIDALITGSAKPPASTDTVVLTYPYTYEGQIRLSDPAAQNAYSAVANRGVFSNQISIGSGLSENQAFAEIEATLRQFSTPYTKIDMTIGEYYLGQGLEKGQAMNFTSHRLGLLALQTLIMQIERDGSHGTQQKIVKLSLDAQS